MKSQYKKLELDKILELLSNEAWSDIAKENVLRITPSYDIDVIKSELAKTDEAFVFASKYGTPRFYNVKDVAFSAGRASQGATLSLRELLDIGLVLREISGLVSWYDQCGGIENSLHEYFLFCMWNSSKALAHKCKKTVRLSSTRGLDGNYTDL